MGDLRVHVGVVAGFTAAHVRLSVDYRTEYGVVTGVRLGVVNDTSACG